LYDCFGLATITPGTGQVSFTEDYYALGHISKFVRPGAYRIASNSFGQGDVEDVAFRNPDGSLALIVFNGRAAPATFKVRWAGQAFLYTLPAGAAATYTWSNLQGLT
jgi:glucosylceramidase